MADTKLSAITTISAPAFTDLVYGEQGGAEFSYPLNRVAGLTERRVCDGRLSLTSGTAVTTSDVAAASTLFWVPVNGGCVLLYDGTRWIAFLQAQLSLALSGLTTGKNYDAFLSYNAGTPALVLGPAWTNDTTRATALVAQDGINVLTGTRTSRYVGTIRASAATTTEDTLIQRYVWNAYNAVPRALFKADATGHTYASSTVQQWRATAANKVEFVLGLAGQAILATIAGDVSPDVTAGFTQTGIALDSVTVMGTSTYTKITGTSTQRLLGGNTGVFTPSAGYHYLAMLEAELGGVSSTFNQAMVTATVLG
jgi:hypothetical protein